MKASLLLLVAALSMAITGRVSAAVLAGPITNSINGHVYYLLSQSTWTDAEAEAITLGGHLVTINDPQESEWVNSTFGNFGDTPRSLWIGLTDQQQEGTFVWISGETPTFTAWEEGQPDNDSEGAVLDDYVHVWPLTGIRSPGLWNDFADQASVFIGVSYPIHGVVEVDPTAIVCPPASIRLSEVEISWPSVLNHVYQVDCRSSLTTNMWVPLFTNLIGTGETMFVYDKIATNQPHKFYRVVCPNE